MRSSNPVTLSHRTGQRPAAFTIIEMLTVMGIIIILMAILLPVISRVRMQVRNVQSMHQINKIAGAIDNYYLEYKAYPGPFANSAFTTGGMATPGVNDIGGNSVSFTQTENMVLGLCGGLVVTGTNSDKTAKVGYGNSTTKTGGANDIISSMGPLCLNGNGARQTRHPAFIDATPGQQMADLGWDAYTSPSGTNGKVMNDGPVPEFMDKFNTYHGGPRAILYLRAVVGNPLNDGTNVASNGYATNAQYDYTTVLPYADPAFGDFFPGQGVSGSTVDTADQYLPVGSNTPNGHYLSYAQPYYSVPTPSGQSATPVNSAGGGGQGWWDSYLGIAGTANASGYPTSPRGANAYILISAGPDGIFGTTDDIFYP